LATVLGMEHSKHGRLGKGLRMHRFVVILGAAFASAGLLLPGAASAVVSPNLVLLYKFDTDTTTAIHDSSASALTGTLVNTDPSTAFVTGAPGKKNGLNLVAAEQQYVDVPQSSALDVNSYTLAAWVRYT